MVRILRAHPLRCGRRGSAEGAVGAVCPLPAKGMRTANWRGCSSTAQGGAFYLEPQSLARTGRSWDDPGGATLQPSRWGQRKCSSNQETLLGPDGGCSLL